MRSHKRWWRKICILVSDVVKVWNDIESVVVSMWNCDERSVVVWLLLCSTKRVDSNPFE